MPGTWATDHVYRPSLALLDPLLWPLVTSLGRPGAVAVVAGIMAMLCLVLQRWCCDNERLVLAKTRAAKLRAEALNLPADSARRKALLHAANPVQWRIMSAAFVPLGLLLGPMIMSVFWLTDRIDARNPPAGTTFQIIAQLNGECTQPVQLALPAGVTVAQEVTPLVQHLPPIRATLEQLAADWKADTTPATLPWAVGAAAEAARTATLASLQRYLAQPQPSAELMWDIELPATPGTFDIGIIGGISGNAAGASTWGTIRLITGDELPPPAVELVERAHQPAKLLQVVRPLGAHPLQQIVALPKDSQALATPPAFLQPFAMLGWHWDPGWILFYIAVYLPVMFVVRWLLKVA